MKWEEQFQAWRLANQAIDSRAREQVLADARHAMRGGGVLDTEEGWCWLEAAPFNRERSRFLAALCKRQQISKRLAYIMVRAGVHERNPSLNRWFIEPAIKSLGVERVCKALLDYLRTGTDVEKAGAASASYWLWGEVAPQNRSMSAVFCETLLHEFVANPDFDVRRRILPLLPLRAEGYPSELKPLVEQAIALARAHSDEYIRHRVEVQLGAGGPYKPIPSAASHL